MQNIQDVNLKQLSEDIWMANDDTVLSGSNMNVRNITLKADVTINVRMNGRIIEKKKITSSKKKQLNYSSALESCKFIECKNVVGAVG